MKLFKQCEHYIQIGFLVVVFGVLPTVTYGTVLSYLESERTSLQSQVVMLEARIAEEKALYLNLQQLSLHAAIDNAVAKKDEVTPKVLTAINI